MLLRLILEDYIPLGTSGIHKVDLTTPHMINLFISKNGSGKTSILKEANPLTPDKSNFEPGGRKYSEHKLGDQFFALDSKPHESNGHSFKVNGKELNPNGTGAAQNDLVKKYFRLDNSLNRVLNGLRVTDLLSGMTSTRRKEIFMQVYPNDTSYALGVYNKLRVEKNDLKGAIRNQVQRYTEENRKLNEITQFGVDELENRIKTIESELRESLLVRGSLEGVTADPELTIKIQDFTRSVDQLAVNKLSGITQTQQEVATAIAFTTELLGLHQEQAGVLKRVISEHAGVLDGLEEFLADPEVFKAQADHIKEDLGLVDTEIAQYTTLLAQYPIFNDPEIPLLNLELVVASFREFLGRVTVASEASLNGATYKGYLTEAERLGNEIRHTRTTLGDLTHKLAHIEKADVVECPDCEHQFKIGITPADVLKLKKEQEALVGKVERLEKHRAELNLKIENDAEWYLSMNQLFMFIRENNHVHILATLIKEYEIGKVDASRLLNALLAYISKFDLMAKREELLKEQNVLDSRIGMLDRNNALDIAVYLSGIERELAEEDSQIAYFKERLETLKRTQHSIVNYSRDVNRLRGLREEILIGLANQSKTELRTRVDERISILSDEKDEYMTSIIKNRSLTAVVSSISADIARLKRRLQIVEIWMDSLCPNKGIIGKLMGDFIRAVCANMNIKLQAIWDTPLFVKPCSKENGDLTYRFPVIVGEGKPCPDITDCSAGERSLIDWTFRAVLLNYHPVDYPLIMDEVGVNLDEIKRGRFFNYVQEYTRQKSSKQLFMVSHYVNQYGLFQNPNIIALRYDGLTVPDEVNQDSIVA